MTINERIKIAINSFDGEVDSIDKLIAVAYFAGREAAAKEICDQAHDIFSEQKKRANHCRYSHMAMEIQGNVDSIRSADYCAEMTNTFGNDATKF